MDIKQTIKNPDLRSMQRAINIFFLLSIISFSTSYGQYFERIYPGLNLTSVGSLDNTIDSGFIICGSQDGGYLMKLNSNGDSEWTKLDTNDMQSASAVIQNDAGNYIVIGSGPSQHWNSEAVVATYDASGNLINDLTIPPVDGWGTSGTTITRSSDRQSFHYCYYTDGYTADNYFTLDNSVVIAGDMTDVGLNSISMDNYGNYYTAANLAFDMDSLFNWRNNVLILSGNIFQHSEKFYDTKITASAITSDGGVMVAGVYDSVGTTYLRMMKFDNTSNLVTDFFIADTDIYSVQQITETTNGGFALLCADNAGSVLHISFLKLNALGIPEWKQHFYGNGTASPKNFKILDDGFVILGTTGVDPYIIRTDNNGRTNTTAVTSPMAQNEIVSVFPNPSNGIFSISVKDFTSKEISLSVLDLQGRLVFTSGVNFSIQQIDLSFLAKGVYQFKFTASEGELKSGKFVIE